MFGMIRIITSLYERREPELTEINESMIESQNPFKIIVVQITESLVESLDLVVESLLESPESEALISNFENLGG